MNETTFTGPIAGDPFLMAGNSDLAPFGYRREEWFASGTARSYAHLGERTPDGRWDARAESEAPFLTRLVAVRPIDPAAFNGTLVVEWLNVSGGGDAAPDWLFLHRHLMREGAAWIGVSVQKAGIDGGGLVPGRPLKEASPERYGTLRHPGDAFAFDIFGSIGRSLRTASAGPVGDLATTCLLGVGESQSAGFLVTYVNAIDPLEPCYDGFLIHGRPGGAAGIDGRYLRAAPGGDVAKISRRMLHGERIREDARVPVLTLQSETDLIVLGSVASRQPDSERFRLWELAGASHFDTYGLIATHRDDGRLASEELAKALAPLTSFMGMPANPAINSGPQQHYVAQAALAHLERWARGGAPPPEAGRLETRDSEPVELATDELGIVRGGIRTPWVDAPSAVLSGLGQQGDGFLFLFGSTLPFGETTLTQLYPGGPDEHLERFEVALRSALDAGFLLEGDSEEIRGLARCGRQPSGFRPE